MSCVMKSTKVHKIQLFSTNTKYIEFTSRKISCTFCSDQAGIGRVFAACLVYVRQNTRIHQIQMGHTNTIFKYTKYTGSTKFCTFCFEQAGKEECLLLVWCVSGKIKENTKYSWDIQTQYSDTQNTQAALSFARFGLNRQVKRSACCLLSVWTNAPLHKITLM